MNSKCRVDFDGNNLKKVSELSSDNTSDYKNLGWIYDEAVYFLCKDKKGVQELKKYHISSRKVEKIARHVDMAYKSGSFVYYVETDEDDESEKKIMKYNMDTNERSECFAKICCDDDIFIVNEQNGRLTVQDSDENEIVVEKGGTYDMD